MMHMGDEAKIGILHRGDAERARLVLSFDISP